MIQSYAHVAFWNQSVNSLATLVKPLIKYLIWIFERGNGVIVCGILELVW